MWSKRIGKIFIFLGVATALLVAFVAKTLYGLFDWSEPSHANAAYCVRGDTELKARVARWDQLAKAKLPIRTSKAELARFFSDNHMNGGIYETRASATIAHVCDVCAPWYCGTSGDIQLDVVVDKAGNVQGVPDVGILYTNCP